MKVKLKPASKIIDYSGLNPSGDVHKFFTNTCALHMDKYVPFDTGTLAETVITNGEINTENVYDNAIVYNTDYASYVYYGCRKDGSHEIKNYSIDKHPKAGPYWDTIMWINEANEVRDEVQDYIKTRRR